MAVELTYESCSEALVSAVPELKGAYEKELERWRGEKPGQYIIYEDIFRPYLESLLDQGGNTEVLTRIFEFSERLATNEDRNVRDLLCIAILEVIVAEDDWWEKSQTYMGPETLRLANEELTRRREVTS